MQNVLLSRDNAFFFLIIINDGFSSVKNIVPLFVQPVLVLREKHSLLNYIWLLKY